MTAAWALLVGLVGVGIGGCVALGLPSPTLFGALLGAMTYAVGFAGRGSRPRPVLRLPPAGLVIGQAVIGVAMGALVDLSTLTQLAGHWLPILLVCFATLACSIGAGWLLARLPGVSPATGVFSMVAGGASGITAIAHELGADPRVVSVVQYLRVLVILFGMPVATALVYRPPRTGATLDAGAGAHPAAGLLYVVCCGAIGLAAARLLRLPAGALLGPLFVAVPIGVWLAPAAGVAVGVPTWLQAAGFVVIGAQVGLRFTAEALRAIARIMPLALLLIIAIVVVSAGFGALLALATGQSALDGYLATTPGGLYAVLAVAADSGADVTFVLAVQVIRLIVMLAAAPAIARLLRRL